MDHTAYGLHRWILCLCRTHSHNHILSSSFPYPLLAIKLLYPNIYDVVITQSAMVMVFGWWHGSPAPVPNRESGAHFEWIHVVIGPQQWRHYLGWLTVYNIGHNITSIVSYERAPMCMMGCAYFFFFFVFLMYFILLYFHVRNEDNFCPNTMMILILCARWEMGRLVTVCKYEFFVLSYSCVLREIDLAMDTIPYDVFVYSFIRWQINANYVECHDSGSWLMQILRTQTCC